MKILIYKVVYIYTSVYSVHFWLHAEPASQRNLILFDVPTFDSSSVHTGRKFCNTSSNIQRLEARKANIYPISREPIAEFCEHFPTVRNRPPVRV